MKRTLAAFAAVLLAFSCAKDPMAGVPELLKQGNYEGARSLLEAAKAAAPDSPPVHYTLFVLNRHLSQQGDARAADARLADCIAEYNWITAREGLAAEHTDMEGSLKKSDKAGPAYMAAHALVYSR